VAGLVHRDKAWPIVLGVDVAQHDAAEPHVGGEDLWVGLDVHEFFELEVCESAGGPTSTLAEATCRKNAKPISVVGFCC